MNRIKQLRKEKNITQLRLSILLEVSQETVSAYERGKHYPSAVSLIKLSKILDASIDYILGQCALKNNITTTDLTENEIRHLIGYRKLDKSKKDKLEGYIEGLLED